MVATILRANELTAHASSIRATETNVKGVFDAMDDRSCSPSPDHKISVFVKVSRPNAP